VAPLLIKRFYLLSISFFFLNNIHFAHAAACCGGGVSVPALIVGDDAGEFTASYTYLDAIDDVDENSIWYPRYSNETDETIKFEYAHIFYDRFQAGVMVPLVRRSLSGDSSTGFGDITTTFGYEYLPEWSYSAWRPRGLGFLEVIIPTGQPPDQSDDTFALDSRGRGFWAVGAGTVLTKIIGNWDYLTALEIHKSFSRSYSNSQTAAKLVPGLGGNLSIGAGYSEKNIRVGTSLMWTYEDATASESTDGGESSPGSVQRFATFSVALNYIFATDYTATIAYADQTLFGDPTNATLGRSGTLSVQRHWLR
jgi:hypothetical protein